MPCQQGVERGANVARLERGVTAWADRVIEVADLAPIVMEEPALHGGERNALIDREDLRVGAVLMVLGQAGGERRDGRSAEQIRDPQPPPEPAQPADHLYGG